MQYVLSPLLIEKFEYESLCKFWLARRYVLVLGQVYSYSFWIYVILMRDLFGSYNSMNCNIADPFVKGLDGCLSIVDSL